MARHLGLSSDEFYEMQPRQMDELITQWEHSQQSNEFMIAQLIACTVNFSMAHPKTPAQPKDYMPSEWAREAVAAKKRPQEMIATEVRWVMEQFMKVQKNG